MTHVLYAIKAAKADLGVCYLYGAKPHLHGPKTDKMKSDCSGAIRRWFARSGLRTFSDGHQQRPIEEFSGSGVQRAFCRRVPVAVARVTVGCLLFMAPRPNHPGHVAMTIGDDITIECRAHHGVCIVDAQENRRRNWDGAGKLDNLFAEVGPDSQPDPDLLEA